MLATSMVPSQRNSCPENKDLARKHEIQRKDAMAQGNAKRRQEGKRRKALVCSFSLRFSASVRHCVKNFVFGSGLARLEIATYIEALQCRLRCCYAKTAWIWLFLMCISLASCGDVDVPDAPEGTDFSPVTETTGGIRGTVLPPGIGASVLIVKDGRILGNPQTDEGGFYTIPDLESGEYDLEIVAAQRFVDVSQRQLEVFAGEWTQAADVMLRPWSDAAIISGKVVDAATDEPLNNAGVLVECTTNVCSPLSAASQLDGTFSLDLWPDLNSTLTIRKSGYQTEQRRIVALGVKGHTDLEIQLQPIQ